MKLIPPFTYFGGKRRVARVVWERFGEVHTYVEPFCGTAAVLLGCPYGPRRKEIINDLNCYIANFFRAVKAAPDEVAEHADRPKVEADLRAVHRWFAEVFDFEDFRNKVCSNMDFYDAKVAGLWAWGQSLWVGEGFAQRGSRRKGLANVSNHQSLNSINKDACRVPGCIFPCSKTLREYLACLACRLADTWILCSDWTVALRHACLMRGKHVGIFLDPPYSHSTGRKRNIYDTDEPDIADAVRDWCIDHGNDPRLRIALCGLEGEHNALEDLGWTTYAWTSSGLQNRKQAPTSRRRQERIWFSPHCLPEGENA